MPNLGATEILIILAVILLLFGSTRLPQLARSLGKSARILKTETKGLYDDETGPPEDPSTTVNPQAALPAGRPTHTPPSAHQRPHQG